MFQIRRLVLGLLLFPMASQAQFLEELAVGYLNTSIETEGFISNPLADGPPLPKMIGKAPEGFSITKLKGTNFVTYTYSNGQWDPTDVTLEPGEGAIYRNPSGIKQTVTFVGTILEDATIEVPKGLSLISPTSPFEGLAPPGAKLKLGPFDNLYIWLKGKFTIYTFLPNGKWAPSEPVFQLGSAYFVRSAKGTNWVNNVPINQ
jgi:hypothetical protein